MYPQTYPQAQGASLNDVAAKQAAYGSDIRSTQPAPQSEIAEQTARIHNAIDMLANSLEQLGARLQPLVRPIPTAVGSNPPEKERAMSMLGGQIAAAAVRLYEIELRVRTVLETLAV